MLAFCVHCRVKQIRAHRFNGVMPRGSGRNLDFCRLWRYNIVAIGNEVLACASDRRNCECKLKTFWSCESHHSARTCETRESIGNKKSGRLFMHRQLWPKIHTRIACAHHCVLRTKPSGVLRPKKSLRTFQDAAGVANQNHCMSGANHSRDGSGIKNLHSNYLSIVIRNSERAHESRFAGLIRWSTVKKSLCVTSFVHFQEEIAW